MRLVLQLVMVPCCKKLTKDKQLPAFLLEVRQGFDLFIYLGFYVVFNTLQVISRRVVGRAEETST